jgi:hypothetical protein
MKRDGFFAGRCWVRAKVGWIFTCLGTEDDRQGDEAEIRGGHCG